MEDGLDYTSEDQPANPENDPGDLDDYEYKQGRLLDDAATVESHEIVDNEAHDDRRTAEEAKQYEEAIANCDPPDVLADACQTLYAVQAEIKSTVEQLELTLDLMALHDGEYRLDPDTVTPLVLFASGQDVEMTEARQAVARLLVVLRIPYDHASTQSNDAGGSSTDDDFPF